MAKKIFCGINKIPKGKKRGTVFECGKAKQIRYYGMVVIDKKVLGALDKKIVDKSKQLDKLFIKLVGLRGKIRGINRKIEGEKDKKVVRKLKNEIDKVNEEKAKVNAEIQKLKK